MANLQEVINALNNVHNLINSNNQNLTFQGNYGLYINYTNKSLTIHHNSSAMQRAINSRRRNNTGAVPYLEPTNNNNDIWVVGFNNFTEVIAFAYMFVDMMHRLYGEKWALSASDGINRGQIPIF